MTEVTKIQEQIESYLKSSKIRFNIDQDSTGCLYEIFVSSLPCYIQVEYDSEAEDDDCVVIQFFIKSFDKKTFLHHEIWDSIINTDHNTSIDQEIDELIQSNKKYNKVLSQISKNIENIKEVCEDYGLEFEDFVNIKYEF